MTNQPDTAAICRNIDTMRKQPSQGRGMDIVVVSTSTPALEETWQERLQAGLGQVAHSEARVVAVCEDWPGGAGNGLGTLYAIQKARQKLQQTTGEDRVDEAECIA